MMENCVLHMLILSSQITKALDKIVYVLSYRAQRVYNVINGEKMNSCN